MNPIHALYYILIPFLFTGCVSKKEKAAPVTAEYLFRNHDDFFLTPPRPQPQSPPTYPWQSQLVGGFPQITKEFFRCRGSLSNPMHVQKREGKETLYHKDCARHGLPLKEGKEFIYPCLMELLNYIQEKSGKQVVITTGHRCPQHNRYCDESPANWGSKHMLGAEVDFYVKGLENKPEEIVALLQRYYQERYAGQSDYITFSRYDKNVTIATLPWYNKEIFIKLYKEGEGRDFDNQHPYPYVGIQVRYDRDLKQRVVFDQEQVENYLRN